MIIIACIDDFGGTMFNNRRLSQDSAVIEKIVERVGEHRLLCAPYSQKLFAHSNVNLVADAEYLQKAEDNDFCFVEASVTAEQIEGCHKVIIYNWNRHYPSDVKFPTAALNNRSLKSKLEFSGTSHKIITEEIYE